jgi:NAD(P)-dependent dehydrogenase (short-subunit alcohol dehydrogenase family)
LDCAGARKAVAAKVPDVRHLDGMTILITGSTQGVGAEIALEAARQGARAVALSGRSAKKARTLIAALEAIGCKAQVFPADISDPDAPARLFTEASAWCGPIDGLVNAAGTTDRASFRDGTLDQWERIFATNARAPFLLMQSFIRQCLDLVRAGTIVNIQSMNGHCGAPDLAIYSASKGALATLTKNAANAHLADRIRVNGINMGWAATPAEQAMQSETLGKGAGWLAKASATMPLGRLLQPIEVARLAVYLLSPQSGLQTGTCIDLEQRVSGAP